MIQVGVACIETSNIVLKSARPEIGGLMRPGFIGEINGPDRILVFELE
jgi:hypothetical protein